MIDSHGRLAGGELQRWLRWFHRLHPTVGFIGYTQSRRHPTKQATRDLIAANANMENLVSLPNHRSASGPKVSADDVFQVDGRRCDRPMRRSTASRVTVRESHPLRVRAARQGRRAVPVHNGSTTDVHAAAVVLPAALAVLAPAASTPRPPATGPPFPAAGAG